MLKFSKTIKTASIAFGIWSTIKLADDPHIQVQGDKNNSEIRNPIYETEIKVQIADHEVENEKDRMDKIEREYSKRLVCNYVYIPKSQFDPKTQLPSESVLDAFEELISNRQGTLADAFIIADNIGHAVRRAETDKEFAQLSTERFGRFIEWVAESVEKQLYFDRAVDRYEFYLTDYFDDFRDANRYNNPEEKLPEIACVNKLIALFELLTIATDLFARRSMDDESIIEQVLKMRAPLRSLILTKIVRIVFADEREGNELKFHKVLKAAEKAGLKDEMEKLLEEALPTVSALVIMNRLLGLPKTSIELDRILADWENRYRTNLENEFEPLEAKSDDL